MVINAGLAIGLSPYLDFLAAAIGTTTAGWSMLLLLWLGTRKFGPAAAMDARLKAKLPKIVLASAVMGAALVGTAYILAPWLYGSALRYGALAGLITVGMVVYSAAVMLTGALRISELKVMLRR